MDFFCLIRDAVRVETAFKIESNESNITNYNYRLLYYYRSINNQLFTIKSTTALTLTLTLTMTMTTTTKTTMMKILSKSNNNKVLLLLRHRHRQLSTHTKGYKGIGSFHSENVDMLMEQSDDDYIIPQLPFEPKKESSHNLNKEEKDHYAGDDFLLDRKKWTFLNHGAFGAALKVGYDRAEQWRYHLERQPLRYFDRDLLPHMVYSARRIATFCNSSRDDITIIPNVTYGLNTILRGYSELYKKKSHVILWDTSYGSLKKMAHEYCPQNVTEIPVSDYLHRCWDNNNDDDGEPSSSSSSSSDLFECALLDTLQKLKNQDNNIQIENALLILDHTTSNTAINMPLERLSEIAKEVYPNMLILVDGAHGLFAQQNLALNTQQLPHVDFYLTNGHKWLCCPRGVGFLYCPHIEIRNSILRHPAVISHGINDGFQSRFLWDGCRDYAAALSVPAVLDYWEQQQQQQEQTKTIDNGGTDTAVSIRTKINNQLREAAQLLIRSWHSNNNRDDWERYLLVPWELHSPMMVLVRLPDNIQSLSPLSSSDDAKTVQDYLYDNFIEVPIKCIQGVLFVRISCHAYNEIHEYERLADTILQFPTKIDE